MKDTPGVIGAAKPITPGVPFVGGSFDRAFWRLAHEDERMTDYLSLIDMNTGSNRCDVTPLFGDAEAFSRLVDDLLDSMVGVEFDVVAAVDALGFILGTALAVRKRKGIAVLRKGGRLPVQTDVVEFVDYTGAKKCLEARTDAFAAGVRVLIVDEWIETGAQIQAAISLVERRGGIVAAIASINIDKGADEKLRQMKYRCFAVMRSR